MYDSKPNLLWENSIYDLVYIASTNYFPCQGNGTLALCKIALPTYLPILH